MKSMKQKAMALFCAFALSFSTVGATGLAWAAGDSTERELLPAEVGTLGTVNVVAANGMSQAYDDLLQAIDNANAGDTVKILADVECDEIIDINKSLAIEGNGHKIKSNASRILCVTAPNVAMSLKDVVFESATAERGVQVNLGNKGVIVDIKNCTIPAPYAVNFTEATDVQANIENSTIEGRCALSLGSDAYSVNVKDSKLIGHNDALYSPEGWYDSGVVVLEGDPNGKIDDPNPKCSVNLEDCTVEATSAVGNKQNAIRFNDTATANQVAITGNSSVFEYVPGSFCENNGGTNQLGITGGTFSDDVSPYCLKGFSPVQNAQGAYEVVMELATAPTVPSNPAPDDSAEFVAPVITMPTDDSNVSGTVDTTNNANSNKADDEPIFGPEDENVFESMRNSNLSANNTANPAVGINEAALAPVQNAGSQAVAPQAAANETAADEAAAAETQEAAEDQASEEAIEDSETPLGQTRAFASNNGATAQMSSLLYNWAPLTVGGLAMAAVAGLVVFFVLRRTNN